MTLLYLGPGVGIGGLVLLVGIGAAFLFLLYAFVYLPIRQAFRQTKKDKLDD